MTVTLYYSTPSLLPIQGFGYLIPQSVAFIDNPERALGVIIDSDAISGQDVLPANSPGGTKVTVMLGGHYWDGWTAYPSPDEGIAMAKSLLQRHLGVTEAPLIEHAKLNRDCIPQYTVGYEDRLKEYAEQLQREFHGKVRVVGNQYNGVGVNDCIIGAWNLARALRGDGWKSRSCGLDRVLDTRPWRLEHTRKAFALRKKKTT